MSISKFAAYIKEREGFEVIESKQGFIIYLIQGDECYIRDVYIYPDSRKVGFASELADKVSAIAKKKKCKFLSGTVQPSKEGSTTSLMVLLGYGMRLHSASQDLIIFKKDL